MTSFLDDSLVDFTNIYKPLLGLQFPKVEKDTGDLTLF